MGASNSKPPAKMRRLVLSETNADITKAKIVLEEVDTPKPRSGQVLVRVVATPVNPSDYGEWMAERPITEPQPIGKEGSGVVVASGGGVYANSIVGKNVGFRNTTKGNGAYAEYVVIDALTGVFPLPDNVVVEDAASHFVNPYTTWGFVETVRKRHVGKTRPGLVHTAAASQLGQMLVKLCKKENITLINVVRRPEQAETLKALGAEHVVVTQGNEWQKELKGLIKEHGIQLAFDAVAGELTGQILDVLPNKGTIFVYGRLSNQGVSGVQPLDLIYRQKKLEGFFLGAWAMQGGKSAAYFRLRTATAAVHAGLVPGGWATSEFENCTLEGMFDQFSEMWSDKGFTGRKLRIVFPEKGAEGGSAEEEKTPVE